MQSTQVTFELPDADAEREFLREYMVPAWERFERMDAFESGWFWPHGRHARHGVEGLEAGEIVFVVNGDPESVVERERERWDDSIEDGRLEDWSTQSFDPEYDDSLDKMQQRLGDVGGRHNYRLRPLVSEFTLNVLHEYDERLPPVGEPTDENPVPTNFWAVIHYAMKQNGYDWYDEIDACTKATKNRLRSLAQFENEEAAQEKLAETIADLEAYADELAEWSTEQEA